MAKRSTIVFATNDIQKLRKRVNSLEEPIHSDRLAKRAVKAKNLASRAVTGTKIAKRSIKAKNLASRAVTGAKIAKRSIKTKKLASRAVTGGKIARRAVETENIARGAVTKSRIAASAITLDKLAPSTVRSLTSNADVRFAGNNTSVPLVNNQGSISGTVELTLPPVTVADNQVIKLDAFSNVSFTDVLSYSVNTFVARQSTDIITTDNHTFSQSPSNLIQAAVPTALTWVDNPPPGTYIYTFTITASAPSQQTSAGSINSRGFTAMVITTNG